MPDHACDRGAARLDPGASRSQAYQPKECNRSGPDDRRETAPHGGQQPRGLTSFGFPARRTSECYTADAGGPRSAVYQGRRIALRKSGQTD